MKLSIIIPMYNVELFIERCLLSCVRQDISYEDYEIIVVNDGSPDNSLVIAEHFAKEYSNIKIVSQPNGGLSAARNTGLSKAIGDYVWFVDSDDWIKDNCLKMIVELLIKENLDALAICASNHIDGIDVRRFSFKENQIIKGVDAMMIGKCHCCVPFTIYKREFLCNNNLSFYKGIFHEDNEFTFRAYYYLERLGFVNDIIYFVFQNQNSITRTFNPKKSHDRIKVANSLNSFIKRVDVKYKIIYHNQISQLLNEALFELINADVQIINSFCDDMYNNKGLFIHLKKSNILKYKIEGLLFSLFPRKTYKVYKFMQFFNRKHKNNKINKHVYQNR